MQLFGYFRASAAYRVRIALNLKGVEVDHIPVQLRLQEQAGAAFRQVNPQGLVPVLVDGELRLSQSLAIIEYLEERFPAPPLLPSDSADRARVRAIAQAIACEIHPLNNLRVLNHLRDGLGIDEDGRQRWYGHWIAEGFSAIEAMLRDMPRTAPVCFGATPGLADICLIPQVFNAERMNCPLDDYPTIRQIAAACRDLPAFRDAAPDHQADAAP